MTPRAYASRYLPVKVPTGQGSTPVRIQRYRLGTPKPAQQQLWSALGDHFAGKKKTPGYRLALTVNDAPFPVESREKIRMPAVRPFWGKGSPEDCQVVLQLASLLGLLGRQTLQDWADENVGLDCNGFVGNFLFRTRPFRPWTADPGNDGAGPSQTIDKLFELAAGKDGKGALTDLDDLDPTKTYMVVRTDQSGRVIPGPNPVGHVALTEPGQFQASYTSMDLTRSGSGMIGNPALRTVESAGPTQGVGENWLVFLKPLQPKGVFEVTRDNIRKVDRVRLAPLPATVS